MKQYSVFFKYGTDYSPLYEDKKGEWWLGGSRLYCPLFFSKREAEKCATIIRKQNHPFLLRGKIVVKKAIVRPLTP